MSAAADTRALARAERADLATLLAELRPDQWDAPTLCEGWRVRDVVAHVYSYEDLGLGRVVLSMLANRGDVDRANAAAMAPYTGLAADELVARARACVEPRGLTAMMGGRIALTDGMIHQQDLRRPLGLPRTIPAERLVAALEVAKGAPTISAAKRIRGLTLTATDVDWSTGSGPVVEGPGESLLLAIAGRRGLSGELSGPGVAALADRIGS